MYIKNQFKMTTDRQEYMKNYMKKYNAEHKEQYHQWYMDNKDKRNAQSKKWQQENKDKLNEKVVCENCGAITNRCNRFRHKHTKKCKEFNNIVA